MYRSLSGPKGLACIVSVALAAVAFSASTAYAANAPSVAASRSVLNYRTMTREQAMAANQRLDRLLGAPRAAAIDGGGNILVVCGDGLPSPGGEQCDDGNLTNGDGCSSTCQVEVPFACTEASGTSTMNDGGFELGGKLTTGAPNPFWVETGTQDLGGGVFFTPICNEAVCLGDPDAELAMEKEHFLWFGGFADTSPTPQIQTATQTRTIPTNRPKLSFYTLRGACNTNNTDTLKVTIDATVVATITCNAVDADWVLQSVNTAPFNNGASHAIKFTGTTTGSTGGGADNFSNIFVDFVTLGGSPYPANVTPVASVCNNDCGNSEPDGTEECDDGNNTNGDGCSASCQVEAGFTCTDAIAGSIESAVKDGSFELGGLNFGDPNPFWTETFTNGFPPICNADCGADLARTGDFFAWNGGGQGTLGVPQTQTLTQTVTIPPAATTMNFFTLRGICATTLTDNLKVNIDGNTVFTLACNATEISYVAHSVNLATAPGGPYNNGGSHTLALVATVTAIDVTPPGTNFTNIFVEDVDAPTGVIVPPTPSVCREVCFSENFDGPSGGDLTGWTVFNTGALPLNWSTSDNVCGGELPDHNFLPGNYTDGSGEAACVDSDGAGPGLVESYLCSPLIAYAGLDDPQLGFLYNYQIFGGNSGEDIFEVLRGTTAPSAGTIGTYTSAFATSSNAGVLAGPGDSESFGVSPQNGYICFHYRADFDWYAQVDDVTISAASCVADADGDGLADNADNCINVSNPLQQDFDLDKIGDICDADFDNNCSVNFLDLNEIKLHFFQVGDLETDLNNDNSTNFLDLNILKAGFFLPPGPSGVPGHLCGP